ncbi:MAG TPA: neuromedin U [Candidatus Dormibacteraeota bacterium]|nr:neuromedin U [Candidatus Dormibacteraeota bacterium]
MKKGHCTRDAVNREDSGTPWRPLGRERPAAAARGRLRTTTPIVVGALVFLLLTHARATAEEPSTTELAKQTQNPVADLISVPFQNNFNFGAGTDRKMVWTMDFQPVIPITLNEDWNLITRTIVPIINQPSLAPGMDSAFGMGDINPSVFLSPAKDRGLIWGVGLTTTLPTATEAEIGSGKWSLGPTAVGLLIEGPWVVGALINQQWSVAGWSSRDVDQMLIQPFINYNIANGWYITSAPIITGNFAASGGNHWTLPVGAGIGKLWRIGKVGLPLNTQIVPFYNAVTPDFGPDWQLRFQFQFLFPR